MFCLYVFFFYFQRVGYLAAAQSFHEETDVLMLTTNMIRKVGCQDIVSVMQVDVKVKYVFTCSQYIYIRTACTVNMSLFKCVMSF